MCKEPFIFGIVKGTNFSMHVTDSMQENVANTMGNLLGGNMANS